MQFRLLLGASSGVCSNHDAASVHKSFDSDQN